MMVISLNRNGDMASVSVSGCPMRCGYCMHTKQDRKEITLDKVISEMSAPTVRRAFIGGMEPATQSNEVKTIIKVLNQRGISVSLKTFGGYPEFLREVHPFVDKYIFEIKSPIDDPELWSKLSGREVEWIKDYLKKLRESLDIVKGKQLKIATRVIPGYIDEAKIKKIGEQLRPFATESSLTQFLGNTLNDYPWSGMKEPTPSIEEMEKFGKTLANYIPLVRISGSGFDKVITR